VLWNTPPVVTEDAAVPLATRARDEHIGRLERALAANRMGGPEMAAVFQAALQAARWTMRVDSADPSIVELLRTVGEAADAMAVVATAREPRVISLRGSLTTVSPGSSTLLDGLTWAIGLWAATASGDSAVAVRLARAQITGASAAVPGEFNLAAAMGAWWTGRSIGPPLIEALRSTDPQTSTGFVRDYGLNVVAPAVAVIRELAGGRDGAFFDAFRDAQTLFGSFWFAEGRGDASDGFLSLPLAGLAQVARSFGLTVHASSQAVPAAVLDVPVTTLCCAVCYQPFKDSEATCQWCAADLGADAPIETTIGQLLGQPSQPCPVCGQPCRLNALWCWNCTTSLR